MVDRDSLTEVGVLEELFLEGVGAESLERVLDKQVEDEGLQVLLWRFLVIGEHDRVLLDERFGDLGFEVCAEGVQAVLKLVQETAEDPERRRQRLTLSEQLFWALVKELVSLKTVHLTTLHKHILRQDHFGIAIDWVNHEVFAAHFVNRWQSQPQVQHGLKDALEEVLSIGLLGFTEVFDHICEGLVVIGDAVAIHRYEHLRGSQRVVRTGLKHCDDFASEGRFVELLQKLQLHRHFLQVAVGPFFATPLSDNEAIVFTKNIDLASF